jgi:peptide/nickel transport system substrate-binding protein
MAGLAACGLAALAPCLPGRGAEGPDFTPDQMGGTLRRVMTAEPQNLNPLTGKDLYERLVSEYVFESLLDRDPDTLELRGVLARQWEVTDDGRVILFHLRPEARFSDGRPVTADDVVFTYETVVNPKIDCRSLASYFEDCERCEKVDDRTVRFVWKKKYFKSLEVSGGFNPILPKHLYEPNVRVDPEKADEAGVTHFNKVLQGVVGSGPYKFERWKTGQEISLVRNERYWAKPRAFDRIVFRLIVDEQSAAQTFLSGDLDDLSLSPEWWVRFQKRPDRDRPDRPGKFRLFRYQTPSNGYSFLGWNHAKYRSVRKPDGTEDRVAAPHPIFGDARVRRAMTLLVDRRRLLKHLYQDVGQVATGPFWPHSPQTDPTVEPWPFDRAGALALLREAGWEDRDDDGWLEDPQGRRLQFEWAIPAGNQSSVDLARIIREEFRRTGIDVSVRFVEWSVFVIKLDRRDFDAVILGWGGGGVEADPYQIWHSDQIQDQGHNFISFRSAEADRLIMDARAELDPAKRHALYHRFHRLLHEEQPYTFFIARESLRAVSTRIEGTRVHPLGMDTQEWWVPPQNRLGERSSQGPSPQPSPARGEGGCEVAGKGGRP